LVYENYFILLYIFSITITWGKVIAARKVKIIGRIFIDLRSTNE